MALRNIEREQIADEPNISVSNTRHGCFLYEFTCWQQEHDLPQDVPEVLQSLGVTSLHWTNFQNKYECVTKTSYLRWNIFKKRAMYAVLAIYLTFGLSIIAIRVFASDDGLFESIVTIGWFPIYGVTVAMNVFRNIREKQILRNSLQDQVIRVVNGQWRRESLPVRLKLHTQAQNCRFGKTYHLLFVLHRQGHANEIDDEVTVASEDSS